MKCPQCQTDNAPNAAFCQKCGFNFQQQQYQPSTGQPPRKNKLSTPLIVIGVVVGVCALCGIIGGIGAVLDKNKQGSVAQSNSSSNIATITSSPGNPTKPTAPPPPPPEVVSNLKWSDYDNVYNTRSNSTDMQKDALWKTFEGKRVNWQGTVYEVSEGTFGGLNLSIKMNDETLTSDILLSLKPEEKQKAMNLTKGKKISFTGKLKMAGGAVLPLSMDEGEIK